MTSGFGPRRRRRTEPAPEPEAEDWLAGYRPSSEDSEDDLFAPRSRRSSPVSPAAPPEDYSETTGSFGPNGSFRPGGYGAPVEPSPPAEPAYGTNGSYGTRGYVDPEPTSSFPARGGYEPEPPTSSFPARGGYEPEPPTSSFPAARAAYEPEPPTSFPAARGDYEPEPSGTSLPARGAYDPTPPPTTSSFGPRGYVPDPPPPPPTSSFGSRYSEPVGAAPPPPTSMFAAPTGFTAPASPQPAVPAQAPPAAETTASTASSASSASTAPVSGATNGNGVVPRRPPPGPAPHPDEEPIFRRWDLSPSSVPASAPQEEPILKYMEPRERTGAARSTYGGRRRAPEPRAGLGASSVAPVTPAPVSSAPISSAPITSPPGSPATVGGRRRRYRDDDEPMTTTGGNPVISSRHSADAEPAADPRFAQPAAFSAPPRRGAEPPLDYPETPGYTDPQGRSARYPMAEPTYVPGRPYEGESRYGADPSYDEPTAYAGAPTYQDAPPYGERPPYDAPPYPDGPSYGDAPPYGDGTSYGDVPPYGEVPRAGGVPYNEAAFGAPQRQLEAPPGRPRRPDESEGGDQPPPGDGMRTVRPDTTGGLPRMTTTSSGSIPRITSNTGSIPRIGSSTSGTIPRIGSNTTGSLRPVRIDPVRPAPRRTSTWMVALASVGVVVLLAVCGLSTYFVFQDEITGSKGGNGSNANASNAPAPPRDISSRQVDPDPLTEAEVFPADAVSGANGATYQLLKKEAVADCTKAATDDLAKLLVDNGCNQVVRGTLKSADGTYLITAGIFNLTDEASALKTHENINATVAAQKGRFTGLLAGAGTEVLVRAPMILGWHARGHYLAYCVIARADGQGFEQGDKAYTQIQADILTTHLRDGVIGARTVPKASGPSGSPAAPSPSTS